MLNRKKYLGLSGLVQRSSKGKALRSVLAASFQELQI